MKIKKQKFKPMYPTKGRRGQDGFVKNDIPERDTAILTKWSEPTALLAAWFNLPPLSRREPEVVAVIDSLSRGNDPFAVSLKGFLAVCEREQVTVMVKAKNQQPRRFVIETNGSAYTPKSKESPIRRRVGESDEQFWSRWTSHRTGCFALIVHRFFEQAGQTLDRWLASAEAKEDLDAALLLQWTLPLADAISLAEPSQDDQTGLDTATHEHTPAVDPDRITRVEAELAEIKALLVRALETRPPRYRVTHHQLVDWDGRGWRSGSTNDNELIAA